MIARRRRPGRLFWKLFLINAALMTTVLATCVWIILGQLSRFYDRELTERLRGEAEAVAEAIRGEFDEAHAAELEGLADRIGALTARDVRVTFVAADGTVWGDSSEDPHRMESHAGRPEIQQAMADGIGESTRWSHTVLKELKYLAVRVGPRDAPAGVVRVAMPVRTIGETLSTTRREIATIAGVAVVAAIALAMGIALLWSRRIARITEAARSLSRGDLSARVPVSGRDEVAALGRSLNRMGERVAAQLATMDRQRRTLDTLVSELREGVIVADDHGRIVLINAEARRVLQVPGEAPAETLAGQSVERVVRQRELQDLLHATDNDRAGESAAMTGIRIEVDSADGRRTLLVRSFGLVLPAVEWSDRSGDTQPRRGRAVVLTDITELTNLVHVKADFAANASHELRTPLTAIGAALETLRTLNWSRDGESAGRFLEVIERQAKRMEAMVSDLLDLSRLETPSARFDAGTIDVNELVEELKASFADTLAAKRIEWSCDIDPDGRSVRVNPDLLRIVLRNLTDNAIRFTAAGGHVKLTLRTDGDDAVVRVADDGCGIAPSEQQRVFERFYQVEPARSGVERGTGLGLSIVRHAVAAMNGRVELQSEPGRGTTVTVHIPKVAGSADPVELRVS